MDESKPESTEEPKFEASDSDNPVPHRPRPRKLIITLTIAPIVLMTIAANIASFFFPALVADHPLTLIAFDARARNLILVSAKVGLVAWFSVALIRRTFFHPLYFLIGRWYGESAIKWIARKSPDIGSLVLQIERWFPRWGVPIVAVYSHPLVCVIAGASRMKMWTFIACNVIGNIIELAIIWQISKWVETPVDSVTGFFERYTLPLTILSIAFFAFVFLRKEKEGSSPIQSIDDIESELESGESGETEVKEDGKAIEVKAQDKKTEDASSKDNKSS